MRTCPPMIRLAASCMPGQLARAAGQNEPAPGMGGKSRAFQPVAHELEDFLDARPDDRDQLRLRQMRRMIAVLADLDAATIVSRSSETDERQAP